MIFRIRKLNDELCVNKPCSSAVYDGKVYFDTIGSVDLKDRLHEYYSKYYVEINTLEELLDLVNECGKDIVITNDGWIIIGVES